jgi:hypothetical protein
MKLISTSVDMLINTIFGIGPLPTLNNFTNGLSTRPRCTISSNGVIGPYFFEIDDAHAVIATSARYVRMLENFLIPELHRFPVHENTHFQQDGATSHTARVTMNLLKDLFPNRLINRNGEVQWPPRSPDLSSCDYFLWGYLKSTVFFIRPATIQDVDTSSSCNNTGGSTTCH